MGNCACGEKKGKRSNHVSADQQAKINEATHQIKAQIKEDIAEAVKEAEEAEEAEAEGEEVPPEVKKEAKRKAKKAKKRASKLETLDRARGVEAMTLNDYNTAIRRLQSVTGEDPTNPGMKITLPEGLEWMTAMLEVMWPSIKVYVEKTFRESLQDMTSQMVEWYGITCQIEEFDLGDSSPGFGPISARKVKGIDGKEDGGVEINLGITYRSDMTLKMNTSAGVIGIQNLDFLGTLFIWLRPFVDEMPLVGGIEFAFVNPPTLELDYTGFTGRVLELAGLKGKVRSYVNDFLASWMLVPNMISIPMHPSVDVAKLKCPPPEGIMRLHVVGAVNLPGADWGGGVDPYIEIRVGAQCFKTKTVRNSKCPVWNETHDFLVYNQEQWVSINVYDSDHVTSDDVIGSVMHLPVNRLCKRRKAEVPLTKDGLPIIGEDDDGDEMPPCRLQLRAEWIAIRDEETASKERLVSVHIAEITDVPDVIKDKKPPFKVKVDVGSRSQETWPGVCKPGAFMDTEDMLKLIRKLGTEQNKSVSEIQQTTTMNMPKDDKLIEQALAMKDGKYILGADDSDKAWWRKKGVYLNWQAFPKEKDAEKDPRITWAGKTETEALPIASKEELKQRKKHYELMHILSTWHVAVMWSLMAKKAATNPYYEHVLHINTDEKVENVKVTILDSANKEVGHANLHVTDDKKGDEADLVGPFDIPVGNGQSITLHGDITVKALEVTNELPANWNLKADSLDTTAEFVEWWKDEVYHEDWSYNKEDGKKWQAVDWPHAKKQKASPEELQKRSKYYEDGSSDNVVGSGAQPIKRAALDACLRSGSITWGDFDIMMGKLLGEEDMPTIAETLEWVNLLIICLWPSIKSFATTTIREQVEPAVQKAAAAAGESLKLASLDITIPKVDLGSKPPFFNTIQVEKIRGPTGWGSPWEGMVITLNNLTFSSDVDMEISIKLSTALGDKVINFGAKSVLFRGTIKAKLGPMLNDIPLIGAAQVTMPNPPDLEIDFTGLTDVVDKLPGMNSLVCGTVVDNVASYVAAPNFIVVPFDPLFNSIELQYPKPIGVLRIKVDSAHHLMAGDTSLMGEKNSDSYVKIRVGAETYETAQCKSLDPTWKIKNVHDFVIHDEDQAVDLEIFDADGLLSGGADDSLGAVHSKETVLGGGIDLIRRGIPVRALLRLGAKGCLRLSHKVKDEVSSTEEHIVYEDVPVKGEDGQESKVIVTASWLNILSDGSRNLAYLVQVHVDDITGLPYPIEARIGSPFKLKVKVGVYETVGKPGVGKPSQMDPAGMLKMARKMHADGSSVHDISVTLELDKEIVEQALAFTEEEAGKAGHDAVIEWCASAPASVMNNRAATSPQFMQRMHLVVPVDRDDEAAQLGRWKAPIQLSILNANDEEIATTEIIYDVAANTNVETSTANTIEGPFSFDVKVEGKQGGGLLSYIGMAGQSTDDFEGKITLRGSLIMEGLKQRIMDAD